MSVYTGGVGADSFIGTYGYDSFDLSQGGDDSAKGAGGGDYFTMGAAFDSGDRLDGGTGTDVIYLQGDYSAGLTVTAAMAGNMEHFYFLNGFDYDITFADSVNNSVSGVVIDAGYLGVGQSLTFNGARETSSFFYIYGGAGDDRLVGGDGGNNFYLTSGGVDFATGGNAQDQFVFNSELSADDRINGGHGHDYLYLNGSYDLVFKANTVRFVEQVYLADGFDYHLRLHDNTVASGDWMSIDAYPLTAGHRAIIDGSREVDAKLSFSGGADRDGLTGGGGDDQLTGNGGADLMNGGGGDDWLWGGAGRDRLTGGAGQDTFQFRDGDSPAANPDLITDLTLSDIIDLNAIDADTTLANDQAFTLVSHFTGAAGQLVVRYDSAAAVTQILMDTDGDGVADQAVDATGNHAGFTQFLL